MMEEAEGMEDEGSSQGEENQVRQNHLQQFRKLQITHQWISKNLDIIRSHS